MADKPTFIFVPGAWHRPASFEPLMQHLAGLGYPSVDVTLPSVDSDPVVESAQQDIDAVLDATAAVIDSGRDAVVVLHSYGGLVGIEAVGKLLARRRKEETPAAGSGRIRRLVFIAAHAPLEGESTSSATSGVTENPPQLAQYWTVVPPYTTPKDLSPESFYHDVPEAERAKYGAMLGKHPISCFRTAVTMPGWGEVPSTYIYTTLDRALPLVYQKFMVKKVKDAAKEGDTRPFEGELGEFTLESGHSPFLSQIEGLGSILIATTEA
ncbi:hypothetical protein NKR23_g2924 [Pleurostoma richardsiae]|uniref:AB hydrolase-1 domain-containing protein n=1 Tax=Pleurostoma richardsiae TaxID=41990 RepID=A0AA38RPA6_9PEZI|nr:hypothetical protein NKR23_g2924 [Pleurostoma richardsiae]